ncbi:hypothetical protein [Fulvivirga sp. M361]|uniref:hypothetical protein n=1 Tax=Fulvivirga sp. M361 TaxID=2594266 RepID=UPI001623C4DE|nr:hypothetical protein [Fulvivirga sp. M361]
MNTFEIPEAGIAFDLPKEWVLFGKTGKLEHGKVQYSYSHDHVQGEGRLINPSIIVTLDKSSWFKDEVHYLDDKLGFYTTMGDTIGPTYSPDDSKNPLTIKGAHFSIGTSGTEDHPYGQYLMLITFWNEKAGFHMEIQTSRVDLESKKAEYEALLASIRNM